MIEGETAPGRTAPLTDVAPAPRSIEFFVASRSFGPVFALLVRACD